MRLQCPPSARVDLCRRAVQQYDQSWANELKDLLLETRAATEQARSNINALILGSLKYAKAQGHDGRHWATFMGAACAPGWKFCMSVREAAAALALNCVSSGMRVVSVEGDETRAEAVTGDWPDPADLAFFRLSQADADQFWDDFVPIAQSLGYTFAWRREGDQLHFTFTK
jgi:hypothetical protein